MTIATAEPLGLGIYRISEDAGRSAQGKLHADVNQQDTIERIARTHGIRLVGMLDETDISGGTPLERRPYGDAIRRVEAGEVQAIVFAYRSRHDRSIVEGAKAIERMDRAGGVLLVGGSVLTHATPDKWAEATLGSFMTEWQKRQIAHDSHKGVAKAVALGRVPYPQVPLGFLLNDDHTVRLADEHVQAVVREAFQMRADGATIVAVRAFLADHGHRRTYQAIRRMLLSPLYVGEIRFGVHANLDPGFDPIVDRKTWERVQEMHATVGRHAKSERLLARLGVVVCDSCGGRMVAGATTRSGKRHTFYRCGRGKHHGCPARAVIKAAAIEEYVSGEARALLADAEERESTVREAVEARAAADVAAAALSTARRRLVTDDDHTDDEVREILAELETDRDVMVALADQLEGECEDVESVNAARDWDRLTAAERRRLIRASIGSVRVRPGRGDVAERCTIEPKRKQSASGAA